MDTRNHHHQKRSARPFLGLVLLFPFDVPKRQYVFHVLKYNLLAWVVCSPRVSQLSTFVLIMAGAGENVGDQSS